MRRGAVVGLFAGVVELLLVVVPVLMPKAHWPGLFHVSPHWLWLKPIAAATTAAATGGACAILSRAFPRILTPRTTLWCITAVALFSIVLPYRTSIWMGSLLLIAAGAAVPVSTYLLRRERTLDGARAMWSSIGVVLVSAAIGAAIVYWPQNRERRARALLPAASPNAPNIILVVLDTVRSPVLTPSDRGLESLPRMAKLASEGVQFTQAIATSSWTLESHASMFTGQYAHHLFSGEETLLNFETPFPHGAPTLAEVLGRHGYLTGGFVANTNYTSREHGLSRGFLHYDDYPLAARDFAASTGLGFKALEFVHRRRGQFLPIGQRSAEQVTSAFLDWFDQRDGRPEFAVQNRFDAHDTNVPVYGNMNATHNENPEINPYHLYSPDELAPMKQAYDDCVRYLDHVVGRLAAALEERGVLASTVLVVTSDHGEHFGEHDLMSHGNSLYRHSLQVPLLVRYPGTIPAGVTVQLPLSLLDLPATLIELAGVPEKLPGTSFSPLWSRPGAAHVGSPLVSSVIVGRDKHKFAPSNWPVSRGSMRSIVAEGFHYILNGDGQEELYDWARDVDEKQNLAASVEHRALLERLRAQVQAVEGRPAGR